MQANNDKSSDKEKQLAIQEGTIKKVTDWLRQEGYEPQNITHLRKDARYYGVVITDETKKQI